MSRVSDIISNARITLNDADKQRYTDATLVKYLNDGIKDFVLTTKILRERIFVELNTTAAIYDVSPYVLDISRVQFMKKAITAKTNEQMDKIDSEWQLAEGEEVQHVIFNDMKKGSFRIYPRVTTAADIVDTNSLYGGLVDITINDDDYQIPSYEDVEQGLENYLILYVIKKPSKVTIDTEDSVFELADEYDLALEYFITSRALRSDTDSENRTFGGEQRQLYLGYVNEALNSSTTNYETVSDRVIEYRGAFNA